MKICGFENPHCNLWELVTFRYFDSLNKGSGLNIDQCLLAQVSGWSVFTKTAARIHCGKCSVPETDSTLL